MTLGAQPILETISSGATGDATLRIEADTDNNNDGDNSWIELLQDAGAHGAYIGFNQNWGGSYSQPDNLFRIVTRSNGTNDYDNFVIVPGSGNVGIGTDNPSKMLDIRGDVALNNYAIFSQGGSSISFGNTGIGVNNENKDIGIDVASPGELEITRGGVHILGIGDKILIDREDTRNIGIGVNNPDSKLTVKGDIHAQEVKVDLNGAIAPDFVFEENYHLPTLGELKEFIAQNKHLPDIPSGEQMNKVGFELKAMDLLLLRKIEELTLYVIDLKEENDAMKREIDQLKGKQ